MAIVDDARLPAASVDLRAATGTAVRAHSLDIDGVTHRYGSFVAVDDVTLSIAPREIVALLGPSGCGKTTLLRIVAGFVAQTRGRVLVEGRAIDDLPPHRRDIGIVFQNYALFPHIRAAWARALDTLFMSPLILPTLAFGLAALMFFSLLGFRTSLVLLMIGHGVVVAPFVLRTTLASLSQLEPALLDSSASLGAGRLYTFGRVTLPIILPGIAAGAFLAFMASLDNVPVSLFLADARSDMLPIRMWGMMESTLDVRIAAVSGVLIAAVLVLMLVMERVVGLTRRMR